MFTLGNTKGNRPFEDFVLEKREDFKGKLHLRNSRFEQGIDRVRKVRRVRFIVVPFPSELMAGSIFNIQKFLEISF